MDFSRSDLDETAADAKALELLNSSPYKEKLATAGLFLKEFQEQAPVLTNLIRPHLGNPLGGKESTRLATINASAPALENKNVAQIAALPLGGTRQSRSVEQSPVDDERQARQLALCA